MVDSVRKIFEVHLCQLTKDLNISSDKDFPIELKFSDKSNGWKFLKLISISEKFDLNTTIVNDSVAAIIKRTKTFQHLPYSYSLVDLNNTFDNEFKSILKGTQWDILKGILLNHVKDSVDNTKREDVKNILEFVDKNIIQL